MRGRNDRLCKDFEVHQKEPSRWWCGLNSLLLLAVTSCVAPARLPETLRVPEKNKVLLHAYVKGVQIYRCQETERPQHFRWALQGTEAVLFDESGNLIGSHYTGPMWEFDLDGSRVGGELIASSAAPGSGAMPWGLFAAKSCNVPGRFQKATYIQCVNTTGGVPPTAPNSPKNGEEIRVHFTAEHIFYK